MNILWKRNLEMAGTERGSSGEKRDFTWD